MYILIETFFSGNSTYRVDGKKLKYGGNETNHIFTIDNTNVLKKKTFTISNIEDIHK